MTPEDTGASFETLTVTRNPLVVGMQKAEIARTTEPLGQHMLQQQPREVGTHTVRRSIRAVLTLRKRNVTWPSWQATMPFSWMTPLDVPGPAAEGVLLLPAALQDRARFQDQQGAQIAVAGLGEP